MDFTMKPIKKQSGFQEDDAVGVRLFQSLEINLPVSLSNSKSVSQEPP